MAVLVEAISVIVPVDVLSSKWPGGFRAYEAECPNQTFCADGHLTRNAMDSRALVERLEREGLTHLSEEGFDEIAVVDAALGLSRSCDWLRLGQARETEIRFCESAQAAPSDIIFVPLAWHHDAEWFYTLDFSIDGMQLHRVQRDGDLDTFFFPVSDAHGSFRAGRLIGRGVGGARLGTIQPSRGSRTGFSKCSSAPATPVGGRTAKSFAGWPSESW